MASPSAYSKPAGVGPVVSHKATSSPRRFATPSRLGAIEEDGGMQPDTPQRPSNRPMARFFHIPFQPREPPSYTQFDDVTGPRGEKFSDLRNNRHIAKRGGLVRVLLIALIVLLVIVGLAVGLGVGLTRSRGNSSPLSSSPPPPQVPAAPFPAGSYSFETYLSTVSTTCTSNPATWRCFPYATYGETGSGADSTFNWIITPRKDNATAYIISSTNNPFALDFHNATLKLTDQGQSSEAYTFSVNMQKTVIPNATLTADGAATNCFYNGTIFSAVLYTKKEKSYPPQNTTSQSATAAYPPWPYAVDVQQVADGGSGVPDCYKMVNGNVGEHVIVGTEPSSQTCRCQYRNYNG